MILRHMLNQSLDLDRVFHALADPARRAIVERLSLGPAPVSELARPLPMSLPAAMQHLGVLERANLIIVKRAGRLRWHYINALPIKEIYDRWISPYATDAVTLLARMKRELES